MSKREAQLCAFALIVRMETVELTALTHMSVILVLVLMDIDYLAKLIVWVCKLFN